MQRLAPELLEIGTGVLLLPVAARQIVASRVRLAGKKRNEFERALARVEWSNQRLNDRDRAVVGASIAPGFEFVRLINVPLTELCRFVLVKAKMNA